MSPPVATWVFWRDYPSGILKNTITDSWAFLIVSVGVLFVNLIGASLWTIMMWSYARWIHNKVGRQPSWLRSFYHHVVREKVTAFRALYVFGRQLGPDQWYRQPFAWLLFVLILFLSYGTLILSIYASYALTFGTEENPGVIAGSRNHQASIWVPNTTESLNGALLFKQLNRNMSTAADSYARACYDQQYTVPCQSSFMSQTLPYNVSILPDVCPFSEEVCVNTSQNAQAATIRHETAWLTMAELSLNTDRNLQIQVAQECAPIQQNVFCKNCRTNKHPFRFVFGTQGFYEFTFYPDSGPWGGYHVLSWPYIPNNHSVNSIDPRLQRQDGTTTIILFSAPGVHYSQPVTDPIFSATEEDTVLGTKFWIASTPTAMGCVSQIRVSDNSRNMVSDWQAPEIAFQDQSFFGDYESENIGLILGWAASSLNVDAVIAGRGAAALRASDSLETGVLQTQIAQNQSWVEATAWFNTSLAKLSLSILTIGISDDNFNSTGFINLLDTNTNIGRAFPHLGDIIKFKDGRYSSVDGVGIIVITIIGTLLWILTQLLTKYKPVEDEIHVHQAIPLFNQAIPPTKPFLYSSYSAAQQSQHGTHSATTSSTVSLTSNAPAPVGNVLGSKASGETNPSGEEPEHQYK